MKLSLNNKFIPFILLFTFLVTNSVRASSDTITINDFPFVAQGHGNGNNFCNGYGNASYLKVYNEATIWGTEGLDLNFCYGFQYMSETSCDNNDGSLRKCNVSFQQLSPKKLKPFKEATGNKNIYCNSSANIYRENIKSFNGYQNCNAWFSSPLHKIKKMNMYDSSTVHFFSGEYWIDKLTMQNSSKIVIHGNVKIHLKNEAEFNGASIEYADENSQLIFVSRDSITLNDSYWPVHKSSTLEGYFYADEDISLHNGSVILGKVNSRILTLTDSSKINNENIIPKQCEYLPMEDFNANDISNWSVIGFGQSIKPTPSGERFVLNSSQKDQATASAYNYLFPSKDNYLEVEFDHYAGFVA
ncbi:hypothetical protein [Vibrio harveyi]|uniref:hypothetical protein n=1 Tax=Vibrio harveyi TaxID=669 RepID=UPI003D7050B4